MLPPEGMRELLAFKTNVCYLKPIRISRVVSIAKTACLTITPVIVIAEFGIFSGILPNKQQLHGILLLQVIYCGGLAFVCIKLDKLSQTHPRFMILQ